MLDSDSSTGIIKPSPNYWYQRFKEAHSSKGVQSIVTPRNDEAEVFVLSCHIFEWMTSRHLDPMRCHVEV